MVRQHHANEPRCFWGADKNESGFSRYRSPCPTLGGQGLKARPCSSEHTTGTRLGTRSKTPVSKAQHQRCEPWRGCEGGEPTFGGVWGGSPTREGGSPTDIGWWVGKVLSTLMAGASGDASP